MFLPILSEFCTLSISFFYLWSLVSGSAFACSWLIMFKPTLPRWQVASVLSVLFVVCKPRLLLCMFCWVHPKLFMLCSFCLVCLPLGLHTLTSLFWWWSEHVQRQTVVKPRVPHACLLRSTWTDGHTVECTSTKRSNVELNYAHPQICKVDGMYWWLVMGHMVPLSRKITLSYENTCDNTLKEIQFRPQDCVTYWRGVMLMVDSVADNWWRVLLLHFIFCLYYS